MIKDKIYLVEFNRFGVHHKYYEISNSIKDIKLGVLGSATDLKITIVKNPNMTEINQNIKEREKILGWMKDKH